MTESWKPIADYPQYLISDLGRVKSMRYEAEGRILKSGYNKAGIQIINLTHDKKSKTHLVHILVAKTFLGERPNKNIIIHINGDKFDNRAVNLRYCSNKEGFQLRKTVGGIYISKKGIIKAGLWLPDGKRARSQFTNVTEANNYLTNLRKEYYENVPPPVSGNMMPEPVAEL